MSRENSNIPSTDLYRVHDLGYEMFMAFNAVAPAVGLRIEGLPDDANEHSKFWQRVAAHILQVPGPSDD